MSQKSLKISPFITTLALIGTVHIAYAEQSGPWSAYLGAHVGYMDAKIKSSTSASGFGGSALGDGDYGYLSSQNMNGGVHAGIDFYPFNIKPGFFGLEASASLSNIEARDCRAVGTNRQSGKLSFKTGPLFSLAFKAGMALNKVAYPYAKIGIARTKWTVKSDYTFDGVRNAHAETNTYLNGLVLGLGVDIPLNKHIVLGFEALHTRYQSLNHTHPNAYPTDVTFNTNPSTTAINLRLSWKI